MIRIFTLGGAAFAAMGTLVTRLPHVSPQWMFAPAEVGVLGALLICVYDDCFLDTSSP
jgi:hypothetical protein